MGRLDIMRFFAINPSLSLIPSLALGVAQPGTAGQSPFCPKKVGIEIRKLISILSILSFIIEYFLTDKVPV